MGHKQHHHDRETTHRRGPEPVHLPSADPTTALQNRIRIRAYELFQAQSGNSPLENWLRAEREILHSSGPRL